MNTTLIHFQRNGETLGSWPALMVETLLDRGDIGLDDTWFVEGMSSAEPVSELMRARAPEVGKVTVTNFPKAPEPSVVKLRSSNVPFIDAFIITFKVLVALIFMSAVVGLAGGLAVFFGRVLTQGLHTLFFSPIFG